jgi:hypothetical protein
MNEIMTWIASQSPGWIFLIFPLFIGCMIVSVWRDHLRQKKLEANPHNMDDNEYQRFNWKRFNR